MVNILLCFVKQFDGNINKVTTIVKAIACAHSLILVIGFSLIYQSSVNRIENVEEQLKMVSVIKVLYREITFRKIYAFNNTVNEDGFK